MASSLDPALGWALRLALAGLWGLAFGFGLIHGLGFAGALGELGLPAGALVVPLLAFNLGVEVGQLAIVALFLPIALTLRALRPPQLVWRLGSALGLRSSSKMTGAGVPRPGLQCLSSASCPQT